MSDEQAHRYVEFLGLWYALDPYYRGWATHCLRGLVRAWILNPVAPPYVIGAAA